MAAEPLTINLFQATVHGSLLHLETARAGNPVARVKLPLSSIVFWTEDPFGGDGDAHLTLHLADGTEVLVVPSPDAEGRGSGPVTELMTDLTVAFESR